MFAFGFDPWQATADEALHARGWSRPGGPDPLAQWEAVRAIRKLRAKIETQEGGSAVLEAMKLCVLHQLVAPQWLADAFVRRHAAVTEAHVSSWDHIEAFGRYWPPGTRLAIERLRRRQKLAVHQAVWHAVLSNPGRTVTRDLFEEIGEQAEIGCSGSKAERLYYSALAQGLPNPLEVRACVEH